MMHHDKTAHVAKGKWKGILGSFGIPDAMLRDRHGECPLCGGVDRFRWDNKDGHGGYICGQCGAGSGFDLAMKFTGQSFREVSDQIDRIVGNVKADEPGRKPMTEEDIRTALRRVWLETKPVQPGDVVDAYLTARGLGELVYPKALRFGAALRDGEGGIRPCMVAMVSDADGRPATMHRTFLRQDGSAKADMERPRKMMPGEIPDGACVRLSDWTGGSIGIAEGIETAMSASVMWQMPCWAAISAGGMEKWVPPSDADEVVIFSDNDAKFSGQAAAYRLANRLAVKGIPVSVKMPDDVGLDWNDVLLGRGKR